MIEAYRKPGWLSYSLLCIFLVLGFLMIKNKPRRIIYSDAAGYYVYLPAVFIHHHFHFETDELRYSEEGIIFSKYTSGVAWLQAPFFLMGHAYAKLSGTEANGYSEPYHYAIRIAGFFYCTTALLMLGGLLRRYFSENIVILTLLGLYFGTNLFYYAMFESGMSHVYNFFLFTCILLLTDSFYKKPGIGKTILLAFLVGLITVTRPTNIIVILLILLWEVYRIPQLKERILFLVQQWKLIVLAAPFVFIPWIPQMMYWKMLSGKWLFYSYGNEGFPYWRGEKIVYVLFDAQGGLFLYSPLLLFALAGLILCIKNKIFSAPAILLIMSLATYVFASWWYWWFGGSFGHRCFVDFYGLLALPFAFVLYKISQQNKWLRYGLIPVAVLMTYISVGLTFSYDPPWDGPQWGWDDYFLRIERIFTTRYW